MNEPTPDPPDAGPPRRRGGLKTLLVLVATSALVLHAWMQVREQLDPTLAALRALRSEVVEDRRVAANDLGALGAAEVRGAIMPLILALGDRDRLVRQNVIDALGRAVMTAGPDPAARLEVRAGVRAVLEALDDPDEQVRWGAVRHLAAYAEGKVGDPARLAAALARMALDRRSLLVQAVAANALSRLAPGMPIAPPAELAAALVDPDRPGDVRGVAAVLLAAFPAGREAALDPLIALLGDPSPPARRGAAAALALLDPIAIRPALTALLAAAARPLDPPPGDGAERLALGWTTSPPGVTFFDPRGPSLPFGLIKDPRDEAAARRRDPAAMAAVALGRIASAGPPDDRPALGLARLLAEDDRDRRAAAAAVLVGLGPRAYPAGPALVAAVGREYREERARAARDSRPPVPYYLISEYPTDLFGALAQVAPGGPFAPDAVAALVEALDHPNWQYRTLAARALGRFGPGAAAALPRLRALRRQDGNQDILGAIRLIEPPPPDVQPADP